MKVYIDKAKLQEYTTKLTAKFKTIFALKGETATDAQVAEAVTDWLDTNVNPVGSAVVVDSTLLIEGAAADAKATGDGLADLTTALTAVAPDAYNFTWTIGKQVDAAGAVTAQSRYACTNAVPAYPGDMIKYTGPARDANHYRLYLHVCEYHDNTLLQRTDISQNTELIISSNCNNLRLSYGSASSAPNMTQERLDTYYSALFYRKSVPVTDVLPVFDTINRINKNIAVTYESGTWGKATERLNIYMPATSGYLLFRLYHYIDNDNDKNCNCWVVTNVYHADDNLSNPVQITIAGEWECALRLDGRDDFVGGYTHGDEVINNDITIICDNVPASKSAFSTKKECNSIRILRTSILYDPADHTTQIADHGVEYVFDRCKGLTINQSIRWKVAESLKNCFLAMFMPSKNYIDRASANSDFEILELPSATGTPLTTIVKNNANNVIMWDTSTGFFADVSTPVYPTGLTGGDRASLEDNGNLDYNKLYFKVCNGATSAVGELWKSTTIYKLDFKN